MTLFRLGLLYDMKMKLKLISWKLSFFYCLSILMYCVSAIANDEFYTESGNFFNLSLNTEIGQIDNFLFANQGEQQTGYLALSPTFNIQTQFEKQLFNLNFVSQHHKYQDFSIDDHSNFQVAPRYQYKLADNKALFINTSFESFFEARGTELTLGVGNSVKKGDQRELSNVSGGYLYGTEESTAKLRIELGQFHHEYKTRRDKTNVLDQQRNFADISFDYLLSGQSYLATNISYENISFSNNHLLDKRKYTALIGMKWQTTEISRLALLVGYQQIKFDDITFDDDDGFKWRFDWRWHPIDSTRVTIRTERGFEEPNRLLNSYRVVDNHNINITSELTDIFKVTSVLGSKREKIIFEQKGETENYLFAQFQLNYQRNEWLGFFIKYEYNELDSSKFTFNYQKNSISMGFNVTI